MNFTYEYLNKELFDKVIAFSYSIGSGLGGPGMIIMLTRDQKEYVIENYRKKNGVLHNWESMIWQILGIDDIEHIIYDKTKKIRERDEQERKQSEECFKDVLLKPDSFEWHRLYYNNCIPKNEDVRGPLEIPVEQDKSPMKELEKSFLGKLSCYSVNARGRFVRSYHSLEEAKKRAMFWIKVWGGIDRENVIPYGAARTDTEETRKREVREAELYMTFITRYSDVIEIIKKYDCPGNAVDEVAEVLGINRGEVEFIYGMFDPVLFSDSRFQTIKKMLGEKL